MTRMTFEEATQLYHTGVSPLVTEIEGELLEMGGKHQEGLIDELKKEPGYFAEMIKALQGVIDADWDVQSRLHIIPDADEAEM